MAQELAHEISSLQGNNLNEIIQKFRLLLMAKRTSFKDNFNELLLLLQSDDNLQKFFRVKLIDECNKRDEVLKLLKCNDTVLVSRALRCTWFFQDLQDPEKFINEVIPLLSFCTRRKVIKLYSKHLARSDVIENMFTILHQLYDSSLALILLPACSQEFVNHTLLSLKTKVPTSVLKKLFNCYPDSVKKYFEFLLESIDKEKRAFYCFKIDNYYVVLCKVASSDPKYFMRMYEKYDNYLPHFSLGKKTSKKVIRADTDRFITNFHKYSKIITCNYENYLSANQIEKLQLHLFPKSITHFFSDVDFEMFEVTKKLNKGARERILLTNFSKAFSRPFIYEEFSRALTVDIIQYFPEQVRMEWINMTLRKTADPLDKVDLLLYLPTSASILSLKTMLENETELNVRISIFKAMLYSLDFNNDFVTLPSILRYFVSRFRNEQFLMSKKVIDSLGRNEKLLLELQIDDWDPIYDLFKLAKLNNQHMKLKRSITEIQHIQIKSFFKKGFPMETHLKKYFQSQISLFKVCNYETCTNSIYEKTCLHFFLKEVSNLIHDEKNVENHLNSLAVQICMYNRRNKKDRIEIPEWLVEKVKSSFTRKKEFDWNMYNLMQSCKKDYVFREKLFPKLFPERMDTDILLFILKKSPGLIVQNVDSVLKKIFENALNVDSMKFFSQLRMYSPFELPQKIIHLCINALQNSSEDGDGKDFQYHAKPNAIRILCLMMPSNCFLKMIEPYYPKSLKIEYTDEDDEFYRIQQEIAQSLKLLNDTALAVVPMKKFAGGDYLKYIVGSINSIVLKIPEAEIIPMLKEWLDSPVSVRKHFIRAFLKIAPKAAKCSFVKELFIKEKNLSMRLLLFQHAFQFFCQEPCQETFNAFKAIVVCLEPTDTSAIERMFNVQKVADDFVSTYIQMLWELVSHKQPEVRATDQNRVIGMIDKEILQLLSEEFRETLLQQIFSLANLENLHTLQFVTNYILYSTDSDIQAMRLDKTMVLLKNLITVHWHEYNLNSYFVFPVRKFVSHFVKTLCESSNKRDKLYMDPCCVLKDFKTQLKAILPEESVIEESLFIDFTITYHEYFVTGGKFSPEFFFKFIKSSLEKYAWISDAVKIDMLRNVLPFNLLSLEGKLLLSELLLSETSELCNLIGLGIIPHQINDDSTMKYFKNIIKLLVENPNQNVKIQSSSFMSKLVSTVKV